MRARVPPVATEMSTRYVWGDIRQPLDGRNGRGSGRTCWSPVTLISQSKSCRQWGAGSGSGRPAPAAAGRRPAVCSWRRTTAGGVLGDAGTASPWSRVTGRRNLDHHQPHEAGEEDSLPRAVVRTSRPGAEHGQAGERVPKTRPTMRGRSGWKFASPLVGPTRGGR